jgi:hypothetical protein
VLGLLNSPEHAAEVEQLRNDLTGACLARWEEEQDTARLRLALESAKRGRRELRAELFGEQAQHRMTLEQRNAHGSELHRLRARVAELEAEAEAESCRCPEPAPLCGGCRCQCHTGDGSTRTADEDPIAFSLTPEALHASSGAVIEIPDRPRDGVYPQGTSHRQQMRDLIAGQRAALGNHDGPPHHDYTIGRDLPEVTS